MIGSILNFFLGSIRSKLIIVVVILYTFLVLFIMGDLIHKQEKFMKNQVYTEGFNLAATLSSNAASWLISYDVAGLNELLNSLKSIKSVRMAMILDENLKVVASTDSSLVGISLNDSISIELKNTLQGSTSSKSQIWHDETIDSLHKINIQGTTIGYSRVLLDTSVYQEEVKSIKRDGIIYVLLAMFFGAFATWLTVYTMTKQLVKLSNASEEVAKGNLDILLPHYNGNDEVSRLTEDFNKMIVQLQKGVHLSKLAVMGEMMGNITHQWRQPLNALSVLASGRLLQIEIGLEYTKEQATNEMTMILNQSQYLSHTIDDFKNFIKDNKEQKQLNLINALQKTLTIVSPNIISNNIELLSNFKDDATILGFENELIQSFINIINNAKDVLVENIEDNKDRFIFIESKKTDNEIILTIKDSGGGIPEDIIPKIFDTYFTTKSKETGTGLGLAMVRKIITEHHNGTIEVSNEEYEYNRKCYRGACFRLVFKLN